MLTLSQRQTLRFTSVTSLEKTAAIAQLVEAIQDAC